MIFMQEWLIMHYHSIKPLKAWVDSTELSWTNSGTTTSFFLSFETAFSSLCVQIHRPRLIPPISRIDYAWVMRIQKKKNGHLRNFALKILLKSALLTSFPDHSSHFRFFCFLIFFSVKNFIWRQFFEKC